LTDDEYAALKADIAEHGILYPVIVDEDERVLDGVHRVRIAEELGIETPVSQMGQLSEERKMHLAVGLNMRRRHLDADRRRELVRKLANEQGLSVRKIASITGWSKSTVDRDLKTSPFQELISRAAEDAAYVRGIGERLGTNAARECFDGIADSYETIGQLFAWADGQWKGGSWPPPLVDHAELTVRMRGFAGTVRGLFDYINATSHAKNEQDHIRANEEFEEKMRLYDKWDCLWNAFTPDVRIDKATKMRDRGMLFDPVPGGTPRRRGAGNGPNGDRL
jgi:hypothetical protein